MGKQHLLEMQKAGMTPTAVCELDSSRLQVAKTDFPGIETYSTVEELLAKSKVELLSIITPHDTHAPLALQCLNAGKHVVCEKPFAIGTAACDEMIAAAEKAGKLLTTYHNRHWDGWIMLAVERILGKEKAIGDVVKIRLVTNGRGMPRNWWRSDMGKSGGIMYDWGVHLIEYALQLLPGAKLTEVTGFAHRGYWASRAPADAGWKSNPNEDEGRLIARFHTGQWIELTISSLDKPISNQVEVVGTEGVYSFGFSSYELWKHEAGVSHTETGKHPEAQSFRLYENVAGHLLRGEPLVITPQWARRPIHIIDLGMQSAKAGKALPAQYP